MSNPEHIQQPAVNPYYPAVATAGTQQAPAPYPGQAAPAYQPPFGQQGIGNQPAPYPTGANLAPYPTGAQPAPYPTGAAGLPPSYSEAVDPNNQSKQPFVHPTVYAQPHPPTGYAPTPHGYTQPILAPPSNTTVILSQPVRYGANPVSCMCPYCAQPIVTSTTHTAGGYACFIAAVLCVCGLGLCFFIPFLLPDCQDVNHSCPNCKKHIATFSRM